MPWKEVLLMEERVRFVSLAESGKQSMASLCREYGISRKTGYKWLGRKRELGLAGLKEMSRKPRSNSRSVSADALKLVLKLKRRHPNWGAKKLHELLCTDCGVADPPCVNSVDNALRRHGLTTRRRRRAKFVRSELGELTEAEHPNHVWAVDFKGWFVLGDGQRCDPLTISDLSSHLVICCKAMRNQQWRPAREAFAQVFRRYGLPEIVRVDNGTPFASVGTLGLSKLSVWWISLGIRVEYTRPGKPSDNGSHERMHRTLKAEATKPASANLRAQQRRFDRWRKTFNHVRPHEGISMRRPAEVYQPSENRYSGNDIEVQYSEGFERVLVGEGGLIYYASRNWYIGEAFAGVEVGLKGKHRLNKEVHFANVRLGRLIYNRKDPFRPSAYMGP